MTPISSLAGILGLSVVSGVNLYLAILVTGMAERFHWVVGLPTELHVLGHPVVLLVVGLLFLLEFFADKIPVVTVVWDGIHTFIRPLGGALLALGAAGDLDPTIQVLAMLAGGTVALGVHGSKMGIRVLAHTTPEPATHSLISLAEDVGVVGLLALAYSHPKVAVPLLLGIILIILLLLPTLLRILHVLLVGVGGRIMSWVKQAGRHDVPVWTELAILGLDPSGSQQVIRAFARKVKGAARLKEGYLARIGGRWLFIHRGLFKPKAVPMDEGPVAPVRLDKGVIWDSLVFLQNQQPRVFLVPKDWSRLFDEWNHTPTTRLAGTTGQPH